MRSPQRPVVAVLNTSIEVIELLAEVLADAGFQVVTAYIVDFKRGHADLAAFLAQHQPQVIVYDIAPPYEENWQYFQHVRRLARMADCQVVLMTTNKTALEGLVGPTASFELVGKPFDLRQIVGAVQAALARCREERGGSRGAVP